jgi:inner membrane protein
MASLFAHAAVPIVARGASFTPKLKRRLVLVAVILACWPDLDYVTLAFEVRPNELLGHRGITHSLFVAGVLAALSALFFFRALVIGTRAWWLVFAFLFGAAASHGLLDAMTSGDIGVALFAPLENGRHFLPVKLIASCPVGLDEYFGYWGLMTLANELLYVVVPLALAVALASTITIPLRMSVAMKRTLAVAAAWAVGVVVLRATMTDFRPTLPRSLLPVDTPQAGMRSDIPHDDLPEGKLVTRLSDLRALALLDRTLTPTATSWSSSFFPTWFGGEGGRWMEGAPRLAWRTLMGFSAPTEPEAHAWLAAANAGDDAAQQRLFTLSPTEKLDLAYGRFDFPATHQSLARTHNAKPKPRYWSGRCNGIATASLSEPEPFRVVDVIAKDGSHVRFHPNDTKALLALAYDQPKTMTIIGEVCTTVSFDAPATCSMNPAVLVLALLNRIGLAKQSFLIDALPTVAKQYYAVAGARVHASAPRPVRHVEMGPTLAPPTTALVDVEIELTLSSTTLSYARANVLDPASSDGTRYERVGLVPVVMKYAATLALDDATELIGGKWTGDPPDGPDDVLIVSGGPVLAGDKLANADQISWLFVRELARASVDEGAPIPTLDLRTQCDGRCP